MFSMVNFYCKQDEITRLSPASDWQIPTIK